MKSSWAELKAFALGGNMLDLALGFILGTALPRSSKASPSGDLVGQRELLIAAAARGGGQALLRAALGVYAAKGRTHAGLAWT